MENRLRSEQLELHMAGDMYEPEATYKYNISINTVYCLMRLWLSVHTSRSTPPSDRAVHINY